MDPNEYRQLGMRKCGYCGLVCGCVDPHDACKACGTPFDGEGGED
jgi:hypothetical protein